MAKSKAELEADRDEYVNLTNEALEAELAGDYRLAIKIAASTWPYIDDMMQFEKRFSKRDFNSVGSIDLVLKHAPLLFNKQALDEIEQLLSEYRRIEKDTAADMEQKLAEAQERMRHNHRLWNHIESNPGCWQNELRTKLGGEQDYWRSVIERWVAMELVSRDPDQGNYRLFINPHTGIGVAAKCSACAHVTSAAKRRFLEPITCPSCARTSDFVILAR